MKLNTRKLRYILLASIISVGALATEIKFICSHREYKKITFQIGGKIDENTGGKIWMKSDYIFGDLKKHYKKFHKRRESTEFIKFTVKTPQQYADKVWLTEFYRISFPKDVFTTARKEFPMFFGYSHANEILPDIDYDIDVDEEMIEQINQERKNYIEELPMFWCAVKDRK